MQYREIEFMREKNVLCQYCSIKFADIAKLRKHDMKHQFKCIMCGKFLTEKKSLLHACGPDHPFTASEGQPETTKRKPQ